MTRLPSFISRRTIRDERRHEGVEPHGCEHDQRHIWNMSAMADFIDLAHFPGSSTGGPFLQALPQRSEVIFGEPVADRDRPLGEHPFEHVTVELL